VVLDGIDWEFGIREQFRLVRCNNCSLIYLNPRPALASIPMIYPPTYGYYKPTGGGLRRILRNIYYKIVLPYPYLDRLKPGTILDVGCATGATNYPFGENGSLRQLKEAGWDAHGVELDERAAEIGRSYGIKIHVGRLTDFVADHRFDVIRFNHVLEHSVSPSQDLAAAAALLAEGGRVIISGPNIASAAFYLFQKYWSGLDLPRHFYHYTPETLLELCKKQGLRMHSEHHDGRPMDLIHSLRHFLQSMEVDGHNSVCQGKTGVPRNSIAETFRGIHWRCLYIAANTLAKLFNRKAISDSYTLVVVRN